jgi:mRNA interferase MazF
VVSRGDIWLVLSETSDVPPPQPQPCVILSPPEIHDYLGLVTVAPITAAGKPAAYRVPLEFGDHGGVIRLEQIRTIEKRALTRQVGTVEPKTLGTALATLREMFAD